MKVPRALLEILALMLLAHGALAVAAGHVGLTALTLWDHSISLLPGVLSCAAAYHFTTSNDAKSFSNLKTFFWGSLRAVALAYVLLAVGCVFFSAARSSLSLAVPLVALCWTPLRWLTYRLVGHVDPEQILIIGTSSLAYKIAGAIQRQEDACRSLLGFLEDGRSVEGQVASYPILGHVDQLERIISQLSPDRIIVALTERRGQLPVNELLRSRLRGIVVENGIRAYERLSGKLAIETLTPSNLVFEQGLRPSEPYATIKRAISVGVAIVGLVATAPLMLFLCALVRLTSEGPIFFRQDRIGLNGRPFQLIKFRSMKVMTEAHSEWAADNENRITWVGHWLRKFRFDELPQFWNILRGHMDLVGPRPHPVSNHALFEREIPYYCLRSIVRPGLTGWAQVRHGYANGLIEETEKMRFDLYYIKNQSLRLDLQILFETAMTVVLGRQQAQDREVPVTPPVNLVPAVQRTLHAA